MKNLIVLAIIAALAWQGYGAYKAKRAEASPPVTEQVPLATSDAPAEVPYRCDGRTHCSQMTSCAEATFFLKNCPGVKMDGNHDGVPCEQQWCSR